MRKIENIDKTIDALCNWIQGELKSEISVEKSDVVEMVKALAELVSARGVKTTRHA